MGDLDNAIVSLVFADGRLGVVDLSRNGIYGYDISTELLGHRGHAARRLPAGDPALRDDEEPASRTTPSPTSWSASPAPTPPSSQNFAQNVLLGRPAPVTIDDGFAALRIAVAARQSQASGQPVDVASVTA